MKTERINWLLAQISVAIDAPIKNSAQAFKAGALIMYLASEICSESGFAMKPGDEGYRKMISDISELVNMPQMPQPLAPDIIGQTITEPNEIDTHGANDAGYIKMFNK